MAIDHLNRIVTPFAAPQVRTVSQATTQVDGSAIYVATATEEPVSLFITEAGDTATALSLTLAPRHIPPREVRLVLAGGSLVRTAAPDRRGRAHPQRRATSPTSSTSPPCSAPSPRTRCRPATACTRPGAASASPASSRGSR